MPQDAPKAFLVPSPGCSFDWAFIEGSLGLTGAIPGVFLDGVCASPLLYENLVVRNVSGHEVIHGLLPLLLAGSFLHGLDLLNEPFDPAGSPLPIRYPVLYGMVNVQHPLLDAFELQETAIVLLLESLLFPLIALDTQLGS